MISEHRIGRELPGVIVFLSYLPSSLMLTSYLRTYICEYIKRIKMTFRSYVLPVVSFFVDRSFSK